MKAIEKDAVTQETISDVATKVISASTTGIRVALVSKRTITVLEFSRDDLRLGEDLIMLEIVKKLAQKETK